MGAVWPTVWIGRGSTMRGLNKAGPKSWPESGRAGLSAAFLFHSLARYNSIRNDGVFGKMVMIPDFDDNGYLPVGIHPAGLGEIAARFGQEPELRRVQIESLHWLVDLAKRVGVQRIIVDGSFVTDKWEPNNIDCALLRAEAFPQDHSADAELWAGLPFIQMVVV